MMNNNKSKARKICALWTALVLSACLFTVPAYATGADPLTVVNNRIIKPGDFQRQDSGAVLLTDDGRRRFLQAWQEKKRDSLTHPFLGEKLNWGMVPYLQALLLARCLRGDLEDYPPFLWK